MKPMKPLVLATVVAMVIVSLFTGGVQATTAGDDNDSLVVSIDSATYLDLDGDLAEDDILTVFTISVPHGDWVFQITYAYCRLVLPSGSYFECTILIVGTYSTITIGLGWYNTAVESGWYHFGLYAWANGPYAPGPGVCTTSFDPPTEGNPGPPVVEIVDVVYE
ncbi:MAG: hypothetical protein ACTSV3_05340 [Candidatus Thorarchaeota archaeon]|nr:MAG: hypothetical protein DRP09_06395 [Candidatus Thorarchaeota archaeon]RLI58479.1 MAG: hypothetical protein DRO87_05560 [Candidatus Thorarchaeota archaeon]